MVREELVAGLKNAVEGGADLEKAKYSFISAGYPPEEVEEAARSVQGGSVLAHEREAVMPVKAVLPSKPLKPSYPLKPIGGTVKNKIKTNLKVVLLIVVLLALVGILLLTVFFRENILGWFG
jgi:hypothetical protein